MKLTDARRIGAEAAIVWQALLNPDVLKACIPGCESLTGSIAEGYEAVVVQKIGPVKARFSGVVRLSDIVEGRTLRISGEGKGGAAGFAKGSAVVSLDPVSQGTLLTYEVDASVGGKVAQLGSRVIDGVARKMADDFFARFQDAVEDPGVGILPDAGNAGAPPDKPTKGWFRRLIGA